MDLQIHSSNPNPVGNKEGVDVQRWRDENTKNSKRRTKGQIRVGNPENKQGGQNTVNQK